MVFVADALGAWLVEQLADAGRKKLTKLVLGSEQERALRRAADAAVWATAEEMSSPGGEQTEQVAMVISEVFRDPVLDMPLAGPVMLLEGLQARIAAQLDVLDDPGLTGAGQSSADVLGVPGAVLADRLTGHLVREVIVRGSGGGPLTPLASQLNHELTRLQIGGMLARLAAEIRGTLASPDSNATVAGRLLQQVTDPFDLEVHRAVQVGDASSGLPVLPAYVPREHDKDLAELVRAAAGGVSGIAVLVGGSSTGKTRACWEALELLRDQDPAWRLWHPIDPSRPEAALRELPVIGSRTVVWLNDAQFYLDVAAGGVGERVAAGLRQLLRDRARSPVLVLATLWPEFWNRLTTRPPSGEDRHAHARELLDGRDIPVSVAFTAAQVEHLAEADDPRLALAAGAAEAGQVTQFLAGAPELMTRYRNAPPAAAALIHAAIDARRLGMGVALPLTFLQAAAPGYLADAEWDALGEDWLEQALAYTAAPGRGVRGPLARIRPRAADATPASGSAYRLADYLEQHGRRARRSLYPPPGFWRAAARFAAPGDLPALAGAAASRGLYRDAARLRKLAAAQGDVREAIALIHQWQSLHPYSSDTDPARWAAAHAALDNPGEVAWLLTTLLGAGADEQAAVLLARDPAAHAVFDHPFDFAHLLEALKAAGAGQQGAALADRVTAHVAADDPDAVARLLNSLHMAGAYKQATALLARDPAAHADLGDPAAVARLLNSLHFMEADEQVAILLARDPAAHADLGDPHAVAALLEALRWAGADEQAAALLARDLGHTALDNPRAVASLLNTLRMASPDKPTAALLAGDPAAHAPLNYPRAVIWLLDALREAGADGQAAALADRAAAQLALDDPVGVFLLVDALREAGAHEQAARLTHRAVTHEKLVAVGWLLDALREAGADEQAAALLAHDPAARAALSDPEAVVGLLQALRGAGADGQAGTLADRAAAFDGSPAVTWLLNALHGVGAHHQADMLLARDPATHADLGDPLAIASLLEALRGAGADGQAGTLADRAAAHAALDDLWAVTQLLDALREAGADEQAKVLIGRLPAAGWFGLFRQQADHEVRYRFGREADGSPAPPWGWDDLD